MGGAGDVPTRGGTCPALQRRWTLKSERNVAHPNGKQGGGMDTKCWWTLGAGVVPPSQCPRVNGIKAKKPTSHPQRGNKIRRRRVKFSRISPDKISFKFKCKTLQRKKRGGNHPHNKNDHSAHIRGVATCERFTGGSFWWPCHRFGPEEQSGVLPHHIGVGRPPYLCPSPWACP